MSYLDLEIARIEKYVAGLGIKLIKHTKQAKGAETQDLGAWSPHEIDIYINEHKTKIDLILTLLHELGHHIHYMHNERPEIPDEVMLPLASLTKTQRKKILDYERNGIALMPTIAIELNLKIPMWKVYMQSVMDTWMYEYLYEHGHYPNSKIKKAKKQELVKLYKGKTNE